MNNKIFVPIIHARIHKRLKEKVSTGNMLEYLQIKECIIRFAYKKNNGHHSDIAETINDLQQLNLIKKVKRLKYQLLYYNDSRLRGDIF